MENAAAHIRLFIMLALSTGQRKTSILELTWDRVDTDRRMIDFNLPGRRITKKRRSVVPIGGNLLGALQDHKQRAMTDHVIEFNGQPVASIRTGFDRAAERAGLPHCTPHVLKHTAISWMAEGGYSIDQISDMTATDAATVKGIYRKFNPDYLRGIADHMDGEIFNGDLHTQGKGRGFSGL